MDRQVSVAAGPDVKNCPFCANPAREIALPYLAVIFCSVCEEVAQIEHKRDSFPEQDSVDAIRGRAVARWNTRAA